MRRKKSSIIILIFLLNFISYGQEIANINQIEIESKILNQKRPVLISTPSSYNENKLVDFDVIYVFDSQHRESFDLVHSSINFMTNKRQFIVVGITSPEYVKQEYYRNNDMLPVPEKVSIDEYQVRKNPNSKNFLRFVNEEVIPEIEKNYRTTPNRIAVGHSLSASLVLSTLTSNQELFNAYIAISPNFAYDKNRLANEMLNLNYKQLIKSKFLYISNANEADYWNEWKIARELVYNHLNEKVKTNNKVVTIIEEYPKIEHWNVYLPSFISGFEKYLSYSNANSELLSKESYEITIKVKVPDKNDKVYITGNQESLANWNPNKIKLKKKSKFEREINLKINNPAQIQFTRGNWETKAYIKNTYEWQNIRIDPSKKNTFEFEVVTWLDKLE